MKKGKRERIFILNLSYCQVLVGRHKESHLLMRNDVFLAAPLSHSSNIPLSSYRRKRDFVFEKDDEILISPLKTLNSPPPLSEDRHGNPNKKKKA